MADTRAATPSLPPPDPRRSDDPAVPSAPTGPTDLVPPADTEEERIEAENDLA